MSIAAYNVESQINRILNDLDCAVSNYAAIANRLSGSRVAAALAGTNDFSAPDGEYHLQVAREMQRLATEVNVPVDWRRVEKVREILAARKTQARPTPFAVILIGGQLFKTVVSGRIETTNSYQDCGGFKDKIVAITAAKLLDGMTNEPLRVTTITNEVRAAETISDKLADFGFN